MPVHRKTGLVAGSLLAAVAASAPALAEETLNAIGYTSNLYVWTELEKPFYEETLPAAGEGVVSVEAVPHDLAGLKGPEVLGLLQNGTLQIASQNLSYMAGDDPRFEGIDLAGLSLTVEEAKKAADAYQPVLERIMKEKFNTHLLGIGPLPAQVFWCREPIGGLADLEGKKIRVFNATLSDFVAGLDGTTVTMPFVEVIPALQRGVADCAVTGTMSGNSARWPEVTSHLYPMNVGWSMIFWAINDDLWESLPQEARDILSEEYAALAQASWEMQPGYDREGIDCSTGGECTIGNAADMTLVPVTDADMERHSRILNDFVLPAWAERCGAACIEEWNATVGAALGVEAPVPN